MNLTRAFAFLVALVLSSAFTAFAQEAVGDRPAPEETPAAEQPAAPTVETESQPTPKPKAKPKAVSETATKGVDGLTPDQFKAAGLDKLSPDELKNLDASLKGYHRKVETKATEKATVEAQQKATEQIKAEHRKSIDTFQSRVDGTLNKLTGHTIIALEDGTRWKQANSEDVYKAPVVDHPSATVTHSAFGYKMRISGLPEFYVDPVR